MRVGARGSFGGQLKALREAAGFTQEELAAIAGLSVHAISALERGSRRRPHVDTVRALSAALDLTAATRDLLVASARGHARKAAIDEPGGISLPVPLTVLLGRDADVHTLSEWLGDPAARLITLTGPGGVGKTRLALELARVVAEERAVRVLFVPLAAVRNPAFVASAIAEAIGLSDVTAAELPRRARIACQDHATLVLLDNLEQVLDAAPLVADLLAAVPEIRVLATSRAPLRVRGEREYAVGPLPLDVGSEAMAPDDLARIPAVRLFLERVRDVRPDFRLTSENRHTVVTICRRLDALPLALELAAPWLKVLTPDDLLRRLSDDVLSTAAGPRDLPERQQTINATVAWSYQLLGATEQRAFRRFAALDGRFSIEAAAAVLAGREGASVSADEALAAAADLIDKSLLLRSEPAVPTRPLYYMLETVRAYAALEATAEGEREDAFEGLVRYCVGEASRAAEGLIGPGQSEWLDRVRDDLENYRGALTWLVARGRTAEACAIAWGLLFFWVIRAHAIEGLEWFEQILNLPSLPPAVEARALVGAATMRYMQGELAQTRLGLTRARLVAQGAGDTEMIVQAENMLGHVEHAGGNVEAARAWFTRSIEGFRTVPVPWGIGNALSGMAGVVLATGDHEGARRLLDEATSSLRHCGPWFQLLAQYVHAILALRRGNADEAIAYVREGLTRIRELDDKFEFVYALVPLAAAAVLKGDDAWAARILGARDAVTDSTGVTVVDKSVQDLRDEAERKARARLGRDRWSRAYAAGRVTSVDSLMKEIDNSFRSRRL